MERGQGPNKLVLDVTDQGEFNNAPIGVRTVDLDVNPARAVPVGLWIVVERLGGGPEDAVDVQMLSDGPVEVREMGEEDENVLHLECGLL